MKIEWLVADITAFGSLDRAECAILKVILAGCVFLPIQVIFMVGETLYGVETPS